MPSEAYNTFKANLNQVKHIRFAHIGSFVPNKRRRPSRKHINRSALITLCASWEQYIEDVALNSVDVLIQCTDSPLDLPDPVQEKIGTYIKNLPSDLERLKLEITDWKSTYKKCTEQAVKNFHSPTRKNIYNLLEQSIGVTYTVFAEPSSCKDGKHLNGIIYTRNMIAHRGVHRERSIGAPKVIESTQIISRLAANTDSYLNEYLTGIHPEQIPPWD